MEEQLAVFTVSYFMDTLYQSTSLTDWKEVSVGKLEIRNQKLTGFGSFVCDEVETIKM